MRIRRTGRRTVSMRSAAALLATLLLSALASAGVARAGDGVQFSGDCTRTYVNKQVGETEQWAITWEVYGDATGNVFKLDGSEPSFIECQLVSEDEGNEIFDCFGSSACSAPPCSGSQWTPIASSLSIPLGFFLPPGVDPTDPFAACQ